MGFSAMVRLYRISDATRYVLLVVRTVLGHWLGAPRIATRLCKPAKFFFVGFCHGDGGCRGFNGGVLSAEKWKHGFRFDGGFNRVSSQFNDFIRSRCAGIADLAFAADLGVGGFFASRADYDMQLDDLEQLGPRWPDKAGCLV